MFTCVHRVGHVVLTTTLVLQHPSLVSSDWISGQSHNDQYSNASGRVCQPTHLMTSLHLATTPILPCELLSVAPMASLRFRHWLIRCDDTSGVIGVLSLEVRLGTRAFEASVGVLAVVKGHAVHAQHVSLQVALLGGTVGAVTALEWSPACGEKPNEKRKYIKPLHQNQSVSVKVLVGSHVAII